VRGRVHTVGAVLLKPFTSRGLPALRRGMTLLWS
jgi:hypothetical protein